MRIGIDLRTLSEGKTTGVEVYAYNLVRELLKIDKKNQYVLFYSAWKQMPAFADADLPSNAQLISLKAPNRLLNASMLFLRYPKLDRLLGGLDLFFSPRFLFTALSKKCPLVVTVHDLSFIHNPSLFSLKQRIWHRVISDKRAVVRAKSVIAVSNSTKADIVNYFKVPEANISVIYPGITTAESSEVFSRGVLERYGIEGEYIFHLATIEPRKNVLGVISAFENLKRSSHPDLKLVIAGGLGWLYNETLDRINESAEKKDIFLIKNVESAEKFALYSQALCFVFPSFYEGFGFPPLEAMSQGCPVVAGSNSSLIEVLGDAALLVNPYRADEIELALRELIDDKNLRNNLIERGKKKAKEFTWERTALKTLEVLENAFMSSQN